MSRSPRIRTFLFDMGNVLVHFCHERMCRQLGALCGHTSAEVRSLLLDSGLQWNFERGLIEPEILHARFEDLVGQKISYDEARLAASDIFQLNTPIVPVLDTLKAQGHRLVLLSNTSVWHFDHILERYDVLQRFDDYVVSFRAGAIKPESAIFEQALAKIHCEPGEAFYTDDIAAYIERGRAYGLQAEIFTDVPALRQQLADRGLAV